MKRILTITAMALSFVLLSSAKNTISAQPRVGVNISFQNFYDDLDPYGRWMDYPDYGYVWIPNAGPDFRPYSTNGHWVWSDDYEWMWVSDYDWGWATFHYGRWFYDSFYGWVWVPGYEWSPAWVAWRDGGDYYGWAPIRPGININIGFSIGSYNPPIDYWCFTPRRYITSRSWYNYAVPRQNNVTIINNTTIINNYNYNNNVFRTGPARRDAERYAGRINSVRFRDVNEPGRARVRGNEVSVYRPNVNRDNNRSMQPRTVQRFDRNRDVTMNDRNTGRNENGIPQRGANDNRNGRDFRTNNDNGITNRRNRDINDRTNNQGNGNNLPQGRDMEGRNNRNRNIDNNPSVPGQPGNNDRRGRDMNDRNNNNTGNGNNLPQPRDMGNRNNRNRDFGNPNNRTNDNNPTIPAQPGGNDRRSRDMNNGGNRNGNERMNMPRENPGQPRSIDRGNAPQQPRSGDMNPGRNMERRSNNNDGGGFQQRRSAPEQPRAQQQPQPQQQQQPRQFERGNNGGGGGGQENGRRRR